jgi:hypothetical protein
MRNESRHWVVVEGGGGGVQRTGERCDAMTGVQPCRRGGGAPLTVGGGWGHHLSHGGLAGSW